LQDRVRLLQGRLDELDNSDAVLRKQQHDMYADLDRRLGQGGLPAGPAAGPPGATQAAEQTAYSQAFDTLKSGKYPAAIAAFKQFLDTYPKSDLADNAQYWLGEAYYVSRDFQNSSTAFKTVVDQYPQSRKTPDALLKLGYSQFELKRYADARATLNDVTKRFPDTDTARLAQERLQRLPGAAGADTTAPASH
jgi:tol-pal system protein YbgF